MYFSLLETTSNLKIKVTKVLYDRVLSFGLISLKRGKRDVRALSFELSKMTPKVGFAGDSARILGEWGADKK